MRASAVRLAAPSLAGSVACVDLETTGGTAESHRIIEVGIVLLEGGVVVEQWSSLVDPGRRIPPSIESFTGITNDMVAGAPSFAELRDEVRRRLDGRLFVAHNARFDYGFVRSEFRRLGERFSAPVLCTVRLSRALHDAPGRHNLDALIERHGLECADRHRALGDAAVLPPLLAALEASAGVGRMEAAIGELARESRLPPHLPPDLADELPERPGVYLFRGEGGTPVYVGKSRDLRSRVLSHFAAGHRDAKEAKLAAQVRSVEWIETGGELGALLLESRLVKEMSPSANRRLRRSVEVLCVRLDAVDGALRPRIATLSDEDFDADREAYGPFRTERDAWRAIEGKAREAGLCLKVLGRERGEGSCFGLQVGRCRGACVGREPLALHDARVRLALAPLKLRPWPFPGPVGLREPGPSGETVLHVVDRWRHLGTVADADGVDELLRAAPGGFDPDGYRIVARCLERAAARDVVRLDRPGRGDA
jgi:DNA polymerase-3 subunit epsilon